MRATPRPPPLLGAMAAILAAALAASPAAHHQAFIVCKPPNSRLCVVWPQSAGAQFAQRTGHWCGLVVGPPMPRDFHTARALGIGDADVTTTVYCDVVLTGGVTESGRGRRGRRHVPLAPRGRFRGQTQSQYLAMERGGADEGKAEAHSAADSSRASVSGNSGMGQAQSQSMYDPSCDDCYGKTDHGSNVKSNSGYGPSLTWDGTSGIIHPVGNKQISSSPTGSYGPSQPGIQENQYYGVPGGNNFAPSGVVGVSPVGNKNYRPGQGGISQGPPTGQGGSSEQFPGRGPSVAGYDPRQQGYGGYPAARPEQNNNLDNRYGPPQGGVTRNYGPGMDRVPGGASYAPGSLINPPTSNLQPNHIGTQGNYNQIKPVGNGYHQGEITVPGTYKPGQNGVSEPGSDSSLPYGTSKHIIPNGQRPYVNGGMYNPDQAGPSRGVYNPKQADIPGRLYNLNQAGTPGGIYNPNLIGTPGAVYNPNQAGTPSDIYNPDQAGTPGGEYNPNQASTPGGVYNPNQGGTPGGAYNPNQAGTPGGAYSPNEAGNPSGAYNRNQAVTPGGAYNSNQAGAPGGVYNINQAGIPGKVYNPKQVSTSALDSNINPQGNTNANHGSLPISGPNPLVQAQRENWPLTSYSPGSSPYFCCVVGPDGNLMPAKGSPYDNGHGINKQYPNSINNIYEKPVFGSENNGPQNGPGYGFGQNNFRPGHQESYGAMRPNHDTSANNYDHRAVVPNGNDNYRPPENIALPGSEVSYTPEGGGPTGSGNYLNPNLDSRDVTSYRPGQNVRGNEINYRPGIATSGSPGPSSGYLLNQNGPSGIGNYAPSQGKVDSYVPGQMGPPNAAGINTLGSDVITGTGTAYGQTPYAGQSIDPSYNSVFPGSAGFKPDPNGLRYNSQPIGSAGSKTGDGANPQGGLGVMGNYNSGQTLAGVRNYLPGLTSSQRGGYGPGAGYIPYEKNPGPDEKNFGAIPNGEPGNILSYGPGQTMGPINSGYGPIQNGNSNNLLGSGHTNPNQDGLGNVASYNPNEGFRQAEKSPYGSGQGVMRQTGSYPPGVDGRQPMHGTELFNKYGSAPVENGYDQRFLGQNNEYNGVPQNFTDGGTIANGDDSEAEASVSQSANGTTASASSRGGTDKGRAQTNVHGTYIGSGSFSAQAQITGENKEAQSEVSGGKKGASSTAQGSGRNNKSQANVQLGSETGSVQTQSLTNGAYHSSNSQVQGSIKGGMADAQARGPGSTSSQAQIGFTPYKDGDKAHDTQKIPFVGGGVASAQSSGRTGQSQSQLHGTFKYGITYNGAAQAGGSVDKDAVFPNRLTFDKIDVFDENDKNINVETENPVDQSSDTAPPLESVPSEESLPPNNIHKLNDLTPVSTDDETAKEEETLKNSESRYSSHTHLDHHKTTGQASPPTPVSGATRSFPSGYTSSGVEDEYTTDREDVQPDEYDTDGAEVEQGEYSNYDDIRDTITHQSLQSPRKPFEVKQTTGGNTQHIVLDSLDNHDAEITQRNSERPDESKTYQPGERIPGTGGYTIPAGFTGSVKSVASKENTYVVGSKESPSQAQTVTLTPGTGKVRYSFPKTVSAGKLRSLQPRPRDDRYVSVSKSVARDLDAEDHVRKQYSHSYYTKSSSCGFFTFTCTMVSGAEGKKKVCRPKIPTNPDGTPIRC